MCLQPKTISYYRIWFRLEASIANQITKLCCITDASVLVFSCYLEKSCQGEQKLCSAMDAK